MSLTKPPVFFVLRNQRSRVWAGTGVMVQIQAEKLAVSVQSDIEVPENSSNVLRSGTKKADVQVETCGGFLHLQLHLIPATQPISARFPGDTPVQRGAMWALARGDQLGPLWTLVGGLDPYEKRRETLLCRSRKRG